MKFSYFNPTQHHAILLTALVVAGTAVAQSPPDWPAKPVRIVVPVAAGGTTDLTARVMAEQ